MGCEKRTKTKGFQYIWVQDCNILVKKNSEEKKNYNEKRLSKIGLRLEAVRRKIIHTRETTRGGGGILIYAKESLSFHAQRVETESVEMLHGQLMTETNITHIISIYRPPKTNKLLFIEQLETIIRSISASENVIVIGDTNIDILNGVVNRTSTKYKNTLCGCGLQCVIPSAEKNTRINRRRASSDVVLGSCMGASGT